MSRQGASQLRRMLTFSNFVEIIPLIATRVEGVHRHSFAVIKTDRDLNREGFELMRLL